MQFPVYVLRNPGGRLYIGQTEDLERRLAEHAAGLSRWTSRHGLWELVHDEIHVTRAAAMAREKALKTGGANQDLRSRVARFLPEKD